MQYLRAVFDQFHESFIRCISQIVMTAIGSEKYFHSTAKNIEHFNSSGVKNTYYSQTKCIMGVCMYVIFQSDINLKNWDWDEKCIHNKQEEFTIHVWCEHINTKSVCGFF